MCLFDHLAVEELKNVRKANIGRKKKEINELFNVAPRLKDATRKVKNVVAVNDDRWINCRRLSTNVAPIGRLN